MRLPFGVSLTPLQPQNPSLHKVQVNFSPNQVSSCEGVNSPPSEEPQKKIVRLYHHKVRLYLCWPASCRPTLRLRLGAVGGGGVYSVCAWPQWDDHRARPSHPYYAGGQSTSDFHTNQAAGVACTEREAPREVFEASRMKG